MRKYPYPYSAAVTVASDIDSASYNRFSAVHELFCDSHLIRPGTVAWNTLGLKEESRWYDRSVGGVRGLGLQLADTFFLIADNTSMGMYRFDHQRRTFRVDYSDGHNACKAIKEWIRHGDIDTFHGFLHYTRDQVLPLIERFYQWCEREAIKKPCTWINHSFRSCPTGLCPESYRPNKYYALAREIARFTIGPLTGREHRPIERRQPWFYGAKPRSHYYINDILYSNGLKYIWLGAGQDELPNRIALPEHWNGGRSSILEPVTMDDGLRYYRFRRCYGKLHARPGVTVQLRTSQIAFDASMLFSATNLELLCKVQGTCILFTHWTHPRSLPIQDETIANFHRLRTYRDQGKIWVTPLHKLLEWTRLRTFLKYDVFFESGSLIINIDSVEDPIFGRQNLTSQDCNDMAFDVSDYVGPVVVCLEGKVIPSKRIQHQEFICQVVNKN